MTITDTTPAAPDLGAGPARAATPALLATEVLKLRTVRAPAVLVAAGVLLTALLAVQAVAGSGAAGAPTVGTAPLLGAVLSAPGRAPLLALIIGVLAVTTERRHQTLAGTLQQTPGRVRLMAAKAAAAMLAGLLLGLLALCTAVLVAVGAGALRASLVDADVLLAAAGTLLTFPLYGLLGAGVGAVLVGTQPIAVLLPTAWLLLLESYAAGLDPRLAPWLPGRLTAALAHSGDLPHLVPIWAGALGLLGYGLLLAAVGTVRLTRADL